MPPTKTDPTLLEQLTEKRQALIDAWSEAINQRETVRGEFETRMASEAKPTDEERKAHEDAEAAFRADCDLREAEIKDFDKRIEDQEEIERRRQEAADAHRGQVTVGNEPLTYTRYNGRGSTGVSYFRDLACALVDGVNFESTTKDQSLSRLQRHGQEMDVEVPKRIESAERRARARFEEAEGRGERRALPYDPFHRGALYNPIEQRVEPNRTDGYGGYFIPPLWLPEEYIPGLRAHAVAANLCRQLDLPPGTDSINIPKLKTLTAVGYQVADSSGVPTKTWTDTFVNANVKTAAGDSDVALQLLEQSPNGITDEVIMTDLMAAYDQFVDGQVIAGDGLNSGQLSGGHIKGIAPSGNWTANVITYTDATPTGQKFVSVFGAMASQIARTRFDASNFKIVCHGRRWFWYSTATDVNGRPLGETPDGGRFNVSSAQEGTLEAEGMVGTLPSVANAPVYIDDNVPTTCTAAGGLTGGTNDIAIAALWDDLWLFKGDLRTNVYREVLSGSLGVRFQIYNYIAFLIRYGQSVAVAQGSGFAPPKGAVSSIVF